VDIARTQRRVSVAEAAKITGTSRNTVKDYLKALTESCHLARHAAGRGTWYALAGAPLKRRAFALLIDGRNRTRWPSSGRRTDLGNALYGCATS